MALRLDKNPSHQHMMVVPRTPVRRLLSVAGLAAAVALAAVLGYLLGVRQSEFDRDYLDRLGARTRMLEVELEGSGRQLADANLAREVDRQALAIQRNELRDLHQTIGELRQQLAFYRRLMDASSSEQGLEVADFEILGAKSPDAYRFRLLLTRPTEQGDWISGNVRLTVTGQQAGKERVLSLPQVMDLDAYPLEFRFRYFKRLSGSLTLPAGFRPLRITVRLASQDEKGLEVERTFVWPDRPA